MRDIYGNDNTLFSDVTNIIMPSISSTESFITFEVDKVGSNICTTTTL